MIPYWVYFEQNCQLTSYALDKRTQNTRVIHTQKILLTHTFSQKKTSRKLVSTISHKRQIKHTDPLSNSYLEQKLINKLIGASALNISTENESPIIMKWWICDAGDRFRPGFSKLRAWWHYVVGTVFFLSLYFGENNNSTLCLFCWKDVDLFSSCSWNTFTHLHFTLQTLSVSRAIIVISKLL